ncbi:TH1 protein [Teladorsagia circumcincta]|uniref:TH1 protein n=1 Tax=Teladorsagia circumcincta TaxID=45464 RepID=A0A2G9UR92_TELCI|nr:TH1 protein [Teladorsagia circumcincta]
MSDWLVALGDPQPEDPKPSAPVKKAKRGRRGAKQSVKKAEEERKQKEEEKTKESDTPKSPSKKHDMEKKLEPFYGRMEAAKSVENTLATLIAKHFSPDIADTIFEDGGVIEWLPELINHRRWRTLLYELMDQYPNCLMLNFAVKLISDAGFQTEISTVSSAAQQSVNIMSDWLVALGDPQPEDPKPSAPVKKAKRGRRGAKQSVKKAEEERKQKEEEKTKESDTPKSPSKKHDMEKKLEPFYGRMEAAKSVENTLATLIAKHFSPDIADTIFEDGGVIEWLPELINHRRWRTLLYELMDQYPNCLMLNFAVKLISDAGFQTEISTVSSAAQQVSRDLLRIICYPVAL